MCSWTERGQLPEYSLFIVVEPSIVPGSYVAVGTFQPGIEIWDCDVMDVIEPECVLGGLVEDKRRTLKPSSHTLAVMGLSANPIYKYILWCEELISVEIFLLPQVPIRPSSCGIFLHRSAWSLWKSTRTRFRASPSTPMRLLFLLHVCSDSSMDDVCRQLWSHCLCVWLPLCFLWFRLQALRGSWMLGLGSLLSLLSLHCPGGRYNDQLWYP